jgi:trypsin-like peptidase
MRRIVNVALVAGVLAAMAAVGVAASATHPSTPARTEPGAPQRVGTIEPANTVLDYLEGARSTTLRYPGAEYVKVHLARLVLLPGDYLTVSDPAGEEVHRVTQSGWATSVTGDTAVLTLHRTPLGRPLDLAGFGATVDQVARGFVPGERTSGREESVCGGDQSRDAVCYKSSQPEVYRNTKAVARLLINGIQLCTAFRVGPANRLLTNHHCLQSSRQAQRTEVWFDYQCAECGGWAVFRPAKVWADRVLDTDSTLDYTLFTVDDFDRIERFGYLRLDPRPAQAGEEVYVPQHPRGLPTRVAIRSDQDRGGDCGVAAPRAHGYGRFTDMTYYCDTDGGSSGSPVLSRSSHRVIGLHHFGGCPNAGVRMELIEPRIADLL